MTVTVLANAFLIDCTGEEPADGAAVVVEGERIKDVKPMEVLLSATRVNAEVFRMEKEIGSVEPGTYADLVVVKGNPLKDLRVFQNPDTLQLIMKGGAVYERLL